MAEEKWYKFTSAKGADNAVERVVLEGTFDDPERALSVGQVGKLTEEEYERVRAHVNLKAVDEGELEGETLGLGFEAPEGAKAKTAKKEAAPPAEQAPDTRGDEMNVTGKEV